MVVYIPWIFRCFILFSIDLTRYYAPKSWSFHLSIKLFPIEAEFNSYCSVFLGKLDLRQVIQGPLFDTGKLTDSDNLR